MGGLLTVWQVTSDEIEGIKKRMSSNVVNLIIDHLQFNHVVSGKNWVMHGFPMFVASTSLLSPLDIWTRIITIFQITRHLKMFMTVLAKATEFWSFLGQQLLNNYPSSTVLGYLVIFCNFRPRPMISTLWSGVRMRLEIRLRRLHTSGLPHERPRATRALWWGAPQTADPPTPGPKKHQKSFRRVGESFLARIRVAHKRLQEHSPTPPRLEGT